MSVRRLIVEVNVDGLNVREFCQQHGVSTWFFYDLRRRWRRDGDAVLEPQSRAPKRVWNKTASDVEDAAVAIRKRLRDAGLDYGPEEVAAELATVVACCPAPATVYRILSPRVRRRRTAQSTQAVSSPVQRGTSERVLAAG